MSQYFLEVIKEPNHWYPEGQWILSRINKNKSTIESAEHWREEEKSHQSGFFCFSSGPLLSRVWLFATPWIAACQASRSITNSQSSPKLLSIESVMPSSHLILCHPLLLLPPLPPSIRVFPMSQLFAWGGQSIGVSALASVLPLNTQDWSLLEWTG